MSNINALYTTPLLEPNVVEPKGRTWMKFAAVAVLLGCGAYVFSGPSTVSDAEETTNLKFVMKDGKLYDDTPCTQCWQYKTPNPTGLFGMCSPCPKGKLGQGSKCVDAPPCKSNQV